MDEQQKHQFITEYLKNLETDLISQIKYMPDDWSGKEVRQYIADVTRDRTFKMTIKQREDYKNTIEISNLL